MIQLILLNQIGLMYSDDERAVELAEVMQTFPITLARRKQVFSATNHEKRHPQLAASVEEKWQLWITYEERRRLCFTLWVRSLY